jgi:hypothetical protein
VQFSQPGIWSILLLVMAPAGGAGRVEGGGGVVVPLTVRDSGVLKTVPLESHACTTTLCLPEAMVTDVSSLLAEVR